jgi:hypothetical protein
MFAIKAELKTKGLVLGNGPLLHRAFMKFRGPKALNDKLPVSLLLTAPKAGPFNHRRI